MGIFFTRARFGKPQLVAGLLLLIFLVQCIWLSAYAVRNRQADPDDLARINSGLQQWKGVGVAGTPAHGSRNNPAIEDTNGLDSALAGRDGYDIHHSPLYYLLASAPVLLWTAALTPESRISWGWLGRLPFLLVGLLMGASLWYVAHRLYGNSAGYVVLALYCFSPGMIRSSAIWYERPEIIAVWGAFGSVFTAIAVAHTLYAPREVVLWNWRRIVLLGLSLALAIGSQFSLIVLVPMVLGLLLYLAPERRRASVVIWAAACVLAALMLLAVYSFDVTAFRNGMMHAQWWAFSGRALLMSGDYRQLLSQMSERSLALDLAIPAALIGFFVWPRARYFGNTAPLLIGILFLALGLAMPHYPGLGFRLVAMPFLFLFTGGILSEALDSQHRILAQSMAWGLLAAYAVWNLMELARVAVS